MIEYKHEQIDPADLPPGMVPADAEDVKAARITGVELVEDVDGAPLAVGDAGTAWSAVWS